MTTKTRRTLIGVVAAAVVLAGAAAFVIWGTANSGAQAESEAERPNTNTAQVTRAPLSSTIRTPGTINFEGTRDLTATVSGVLTMVPAPGTVVTPGYQLYRVNDSPVMLMRGDLPAWREFTEGMDDGRDVQQLEQNLADLGFFKGTVDGRFTDLTAAGIRAWQKALGMEQTGSVPLGWIVFSPTDIRAGEAKASVGADVAPGTTVYSASGSTPKILADVAATERDNLPVGAAVSIGLPGGGETTGKIESVGAPQEKKGDDGKTKLVVPVVVAADDPATIANAVPLTAQLTFTHATEEEVLQVPVSALIAVSKDEFAVEVVHKGKVKTVPVKTGRFSSGFVEIVEGKLDAGDEVVVPE